MIESLNKKEWKEFFISEIFEKIQRGKRLIKEHQKEGKLPYVSSTASNNGVDNFIGNEIGVRKYDNCLSLANSGSVGACFYEPYEFIASDHVTHLKGNYSKYAYLFMSCMLNRLSEKYNFNREINDTRIKREKIFLPVNSKGEPDYEFMEEYIKEREAKLKNQYKEHIKSLVEKLHKEVCINKEWQDFYISKIFEIKAGKRLTKANMKSGNIPFIGATDSNNGITNFVSNENTSTDKGILGVNYNGSIVETFYHPYKCTFSDDVKRFLTKEVEGNKYIYLFLKNTILKQKCKYMYGYKFNENRMLKQKIMLPVNSKGEPDYKYMEDYMKYLEQKKLLEYLDYIK